MTRLPILPKSLHKYITGGVGLGSASIYSSSEERKSRIDLRKLTYFRMPARAAGHDCTRICVAAVEDYDPEGTDGFYGRVIAYENSYVWRLTGPTRRGWTVEDGKLSAEPEARARATAYAEEKALDALRTMIKKEVHTARNEAKPTTKLKHVRSRMRDVEKQSRELGREMKRLQKEERALLKLLD